MSQSYSVLMSVYHKEKPEYLRESMESIYNQTVPTDNFVLVCDGPLNPPLDEVIAEMQEKFGDRLYVHRLAKNGGLGNALNEGMTKCKNELIARMDSDDIARPDRCEKQLQIFASHSGYSIVGGIVEEFSKDIHHINARRVVPEKQQDIIRFAKRRNPFNHPCVMYRKSVVQKLGGYWKYKVEDYNLWVRMLQNGYQGYNMQEPLLWMRAGEDMYKRRGDWKDFLSQKRLFKYMYDSHFISITEYVLIIAIRMGAVLTPNFMRAFLFKTLLRKS